MATQSKEFHAAYDRAYAAAWSRRDPSAAEAVQKREAHDAAVAAARKATTPA